MKTIKSAILITNNRNNITPFLAKYRDKAQYYWYWDREDDDLLNHLINGEIPSMKRMMNSIEFWLEFKLIYDTKVIKISSHIDDIENLIMSLNKVI